MATKNETFVLAKLNILENVAAELIVVLAVAMKMPDWPQALHRNMGQSIRYSAAIKRGNASSVDPLELQSEMLRQLDNFFAMVAAYQKESGTP